MLGIVSNSAGQTKKIGKKFFRFLKKEDIVLLEGELGGGKTTFVKGVAAGFGYRGQVLSPSFTLVRQYQIRAITIYHLDLYRLRPDDFSLLGLEGYLYDRQAVSFVEWGKKLEKYLPKYLKVSFFYLGENKRKLLFSQKGYRQAKLKDFKD